MIEVGVEQVHKGGLQRQKEASAAWK